MSLASGFGGPCLSGPVIGLIDPLASPSVRAFACCIIYRRGGISQDINHISCKHPISGRVFRVSCLLMYGRCGRCVCAFAVRGSHETQKEGRISSIPSLNAIIIRSDSRRPRVWGKESRRQSISHRNPCVNKSNIRCKMRSQVLGGKEKSAFKQTLVAKNVITGFAYGR